MDKTSLGDRMKRYEAVNRNFITPRTPTIIRVDGKAFHTFTKRFDFPFAQDFHDIMVLTAVALMVEVQCARVAYMQSDEISVLLNDWDTHESQQWFGGNLQKMTSISSAIATAVFNFEMVRRFGPFEHWQNLPKFDSRVFQLPKEEVNNYFVWRQQDASRNSVQMLGRSKFSHKELHGVNNSGIQDKLMAEHNINWNDLDTWKRRGMCVLPSKCSYSSVSPVFVDEEIPLFTADRDYIERCLVPHVDEC